MRFFLFFLAAALTTGCSYMRTGFVLDELNQPGAPSDRPAHPDVPTRVARLTRTQLADSYLVPTAVATWMNALGENAEPLLQFYDCLLRSHGAAQAECFRTFMAITVVGS